MFIVSLTYTKPFPEVEPHLPAHMTFVKAHFENGNFLASGKKIPRTGGIILSGVASRSELDEILEQDPFHIHRVAEFEVTEFAPTTTCPELAYMKGK